jgi:hypothetical protein
MCHPQQQAALAHLVEVLVVAMGKEISVYGTEQAIAGLLKTKRIGLIAERMPGYTKAELKVRVHYVKAVLLFAVKIAVLRLEVLLLLAAASGIPKPNAGMCTLKKKKPIAVVAVISFGVQSAQVQKVLAPATSGIVKPPQGGGLRKK